ncbi:MAG: peptidoglycan editing factor PgeF [Thermodesulfovibrionales bacterium]|nr:peptidoglycan editing factor PgeF [Thermodesulfovibrionales bacterium]
MSNSLIIPPFNDETFIMFFTTKYLHREPNDFIKEEFYKTAYLYMSIQRHTDLVIDINKSTLPQIADAVITSEFGTFLGVKTADCVPILIADKRQSVISAVHAGWRGTAQSIVKKTIKNMITNYGCKNTDLMVAIGPSIRMCCYEVGEEVYLQVKEATGEGEYFRKGKDRYFIDLQMANKTQLLELGVKNIWISDDCTCCLKDKYHSFRRDKEMALRQYAIIGIKKET